MQDEEDELSSSYSYTEESFSDEQAPVKVYTKDYKLHEFSFSTTERALPDVPLPRDYQLSNEQFWVNGNGKPNVENIKEHLAFEGRLKKEHVMWLIDQVYALFCAEPNVLLVPAPVTVCGDTHGQYYDLLKLFVIGGDPESHSYLFLGDYVDRGDFSVEVCILLFTYKILHPDRFFMLRGNHECRHLTEYFTFKEECIYKYDLEVYDSIMDTFDALPLAAIMNQQFFCVHGGLSPDVHSIDDINAIDRFCEPPSSGPMCDLLWADPLEDFGDHVSDDWQFNELRKTSYSFSYNATCKFLDDNNFLSIIRAHEAQDAGYKMYPKNNKTGFPSLITLFSAPAYLSHFPNKAAVLRYENNIMNIRQFNDSPHPYYLPNFMNVFAWSLPFVAEKLGELLLGFLNLVNDDEAEVQEQEERLHQEDLDRRRLALRNKVQSVSRMLSMYKHLREEREALLNLGAISPDGTRIPDIQPVEELKRPSIGELSRSRSQLALALKINQNATFEEVKQLDRANEARPDIEVPPTTAAVPPTTIDMERKLQRKRSRDDIRGSSQFKSSLENLQRRSKGTVVEPQQIPQIGVATEPETTDKDSEEKVQPSSPGRRGGSRSKKTTTTVTTKPSSSSRKKRDNKKTSEPNTSASVAASPVSSSSSVVPSLPTGSAPPPSPSGGSSGSSPRSNSSPKSSPRDEKESPKSKKEGKKDDSESKEGKSRRTSRLSKEKDTKEKRRDSTNKK
eukprot:TRINITY_DN7842_c0_g3_i1.p1 TRINITY_DN7842_c0_g3~~TRINITY_DN7842_c0_g3_i1.p1  ORF type:complete len:731 (+),score=167.66 TRINITY_DN7842_c0_g3_i1:154-2346(+)